MPAAGSHYTRHVATPQTCCACRSGQPEDNAEDCTTSSSSAGVVFLPASYRLACAILRETMEKVGARWAVVCAC